MTSLELERAVRELGRRWREVPACATLRERAELHALALLLYVLDVLSATAPTWVFVLMFVGALQLRECA